MPSGLAPRVVDGAYTRCVELERVVRHCELPSPERWAKEPLHPRVLRLAAELTTSERAEIGSLLMCYLHAKPMAAISLWWQEKADFEVCVLLERFLGSAEQQGALPNALASEKGWAFPERARLESRVLLPAGENGSLQKPPMDRVIRFRKGPGGVASIEMEETPAQQEPLLARVG
ncbi:MAG: hypothetical protein ING65_14765 [Rhodocyclaceae bacterium]|nr:hypothetical protein [Rhodocyclaceae bacterium]